MYVLTSGTNVLKFPYSLVELRKDNPDTSFPSQLSDGELKSWGVFPVTPTTAPSYDPATETLIQSEPILEGDLWLQSWAVEEASTEEIAQRLEQQSAMVRQERNLKLQACDWTQLPDAPVDAAVWAVYRQELRDVGAQEGFPWDVVWPEPPEV